ncbi:hypothetical protein X943_003489 [Babesia divergens]|uniref:Uncharacterized protein n=1 Tax=Babesia divergens TaxID=32595 RepID=A0AAD9GLG6_BABDI|nr:hypothetical protein X943_003489 [Babesia divergens]
MATEESLTQTKDLFDDDKDLDFTELKGNDSSTAPSSSYGTTKQVPRDIEKWLIDNLKEIIPQDMQSMYINKNNILFAYQKDALRDDEIEPREKWLYNLTNGGRRTILSSFDISAPYTKIVNNRMEEARKRVALDYKTDPSFLRVIDIKTGRYILSNLVKAASEQRTGLMNYVEYIRNNIHVVPLLEELNRYALMQKIAYKDARKQLWFIMGLAEELKLVERTKSFKYKILVGKNPDNDKNAFLLDKYITAKWLQGRRDNTAPALQTNDTMTSAAMQEMSNSSFMQDSFFNKIMAADSGLNMAFGENMQSFSGFKSLNLIQDSALTESKILNAMSMSGDNAELFDSALMGASSNMFAFENSVENRKNITSFKGSVTGNSWQALEQLRKKKTKTTDAQNVDNVQKTLEKIGNKRVSHETKNAINTVMVLEAACKLYGTGPKWSNPDKNEFDATNNKKQIVYVKPPKNINQNSIAYDYLMQYKSVHQKLNGGIRQQHALSYGIITLNTSTQGEPVTSFTVNSQPWHDPTYVNKWKKLGAYLGKSPPWMTALHHSHKKVQPEDTAPEVLHPVQQDAAKEPESVAKNKESDVICSPVVHAEDETCNQADHSVVSHEVIEEHPVPVYDMEEHTKTSNTKEATINDAHKDEEKDCDVNEGSGRIQQHEQPADEEDTTSAMPPSASPDIGEHTVQHKSVDPEPTEIQHVAKEMDTVVKHIQIDASKDAEGPVQLVDNGMKQMKLTHLFRYVYTKMKKVKQLPECSPELLGLSHPAKPKIRKRPDVEEVSIAGKRKRILDDDFIPEALNLNYVQIREETPVSSRTPDEADTTTEAEDANVTSDTPQTMVKPKISKREKIHKMRDFLKTMFEVEAEESEDENLSDPEDIRKKLQLLKERLQYSEGESESDLESDSEVADEMKDFIGEVDKINTEDEELARQRFFADIQKQEENELAKLMPLKERSEREMTRREERMKLLMQLKNAKNLRGIQDLHLSDFESSDDEDEDRHASGKKKKRISKAELEQLLNFKAGTYQQPKAISKTEELQQFVEFKLLSSTKQTSKLMVKCMHAIQTISLTLKVK